MTVKVDDYMTKVVDMCNIKISCMALVKETTQYHCDSDDFRLRKVDLDVKVTVTCKLMHSVIQGSLYFQTTLMGRRKCDLILQVVLK